MGRIVASVVVGYLAMFGIVFTTFTIAYLGMGTNRAFQPGTYEVSGLWLGVSFVLAFVAAIVGGVVCAAIARSRKGPRALAIAVLALGLLMAIPVLTSGDKATPTRGESVGNLEAMQSGVQPAWVALTNPFVGLIGVLIGAGLRRVDHP